MTLKLSWHAVARKLAKVCAKLLYCGRLIALFFLWISAERIPKLNRHSGLLFLLREITAAPSPLVIYAFNFIAHDFRKLNRKLNRCVVLQSLL